MRIFILISSLILLTSCITPMESNSNENFYITRSTPVTVEVHNDRDGIQGLIEAKLMSLGLNVLPREIAELKTETSQTNTTHGNQIKRHSSSSAIKYYPSALVVFVDASVRYDALMRGFYHFNARFIDLESKRLLGVTTFSQMTNWVSVNHTLNQFSKEVSQHLK